MRHPFLRTLAGSAAPAATDPNFENVTLLLHGDGTNGGQNNTFVDGSTNNFTITRNGNTTQGTFSPYGDLWSNYFDGTGDYLVTPTNAALSVGTGDFTCETFVYFNALEVNNHGIVSQLTTGDGSNHSIVFLTVGSTVYLRVQNLIAVAFEGTATVTVGQWYHFALVRSGTNIAAFVNGSRINSGTNSTNIVKQIFTVGRLYSGNDQEYSKAYISNLRLVKGSAVYDPTQTTLTVPASPLTAITNTSLLTCQSNRFRDVSANNFTITRNGDVSVQRFSPFSPTAAYAAGTIGGSGYFDGTGDSLTISSATGLCNFATGEAFTFQCWIYRLGTGVQSFIQGGANTFQITALGSTGGFTYGKAGVSDLFFGVGACPLSTWTHVTLCRNTSNQSRMWVNGVSVASSSSDTYSFNAAATAIGSNSPPTANYVNGHLSDMRILKGQALYDPTSSANIDVPAAPLTAITNTSFLLNFTNAAIVDNAMMAVPETVGNAQIDTTIKKYGTGSMKFDGTGDYLAVRNNPAFSFGTGDFTIECWAYIAGNSSLDNGGNRVAGIFSAYTPTGTSTSSYTFEILGNSTTTGTGLGFYNNVSSVQTSVVATTTIAQNTWHHIAVARSGTTTRLFLNGAVVASGTLGNQNVNTDYTINIGRLGLAGYLQEFNGYIDDLRITKGVARYTAAFTPPTAALPDL